MPGLTKIDPDMSGIIISVMMVQEEVLHLQQFFMCVCDKEVNNQAKGKDKLYEDDCQCKCKMDKTA